MTTTTEHVHFTVTGPGLTGICRGLVLDGRWREAINALTENLRPGFTHEMAVSILTGKQTLTGDSNIGLALADDDDKDYIRTLGEVYSPCVYLASLGRFMEPYAVVTSYAQGDLGGAAPGHQNRWRPFAAPGKRMGSRTSDSLYRAQRYMDDPTNDRAELSTYRGSLHVTLWRFCAEQPSWTSLVRDFQTALDASPRMLSERGGCELREYVEEEPDTSLIDEYVADPDATTSRLCKDAALEIGDATPEELSLEFNGWLSPDGEMCACEYGLHNSASSKLASKHGVDTNGNAPLALEEAGWAKLSKGRWLWARPVTDAQERAVRGWYMDNDRAVPSMMEDMLTDEAGHL